MKKLYIDKQLNIHHFNVINFFLKIPGYREAALLNKSDLFPRIFRILVDLHIKWCPDKVQRSSVTQCSPLSVYNYLKVWQQWIQSIIISLTAGLIQYNMGGIEGSKLNLRLIFVFFSCQVGCILSENS